MINKPLIESKELKIMRSLNSRMKLSEEDQNYYRILEKGYEGEVQFNHLLEKLVNERLILQGLLLEYNKTLFQVDVVVISPETIFMIEVKNFEGDYFIDGETWFKVPRFETKDPLLQLKRSEPLFRRLLKEHGFNFPIDSNLVFINPNFFLYHAPLNSPIIFPPHINKFLTKLNSSRGKLNNKHFKLAEKLVSLHSDKPPYSLLPKYEYEELEKGIVCGGCMSIIRNSSDAKVIVCKKCGFVETLPSALLRNIEEYSLLYPDRKLTTNSLYDWSNQVISKHLLWNVLIKNFKQHKNGTATYYTKLLT